ncbi:hypothetical protein V491_01129 [Pseudogymnoascus sp. VKM F-3775]|nr:hypothetical protein V491_01129 [Pseudogymnoascus sp. VKM F-3775]
MSDTINCSPGSPTPSHIGNTQHHITTASSKSAIHLPTLSGIAKELLLAEAHYAIENAGYRRQIEELESRIKGQSNLISSRTRRIADLELVIKCEGKLIKIQDEQAKRAREVIKGYREALDISNSRVVTLLAQHMAPTPVPIDVLSDKREDSPAKSVSTPEATTRLSIRTAVSNPTITTDTPAKSVSAHEATTHASIKPAASTLTTTTNTLLPTPETNLPSPDKPAVSTPTTTTDTPGIPLPAPKTNLPFLDTSAPPPTLNLCHGPNYTFGNPAPIFIFGNQTLVHPTPASQSKPTPRLKPHYTHTRSKSADPRISLALSPFSLQPFGLEA